MAGRSGGCATWIGLGVQPMWATPVGGFFLWRWLNYDDENYSEACSDGGTCSGGDTLNMWMGLGFTALAVLCALLMVWLYVRWKRKDRHDARLVESGARAPGVLVRANATTTSINERQVYKLFFQVTPPEGPPFEVATRALGSMPRGTAVTVAYDPKHPKEGIVVQDLGQV